MAFEFYQGMEDSYERYRTFYDCGPVERPLIGFYRAGFFPLEICDYAETLRNRKNLQPEELEVEPLVRAYEDIALQGREAGEDVLRTLEPFAGIPWMEAMLGCTVNSGNQSMTAEPVRHVLDRMDDLVITEDNPWLRKLLEFCSFVREYKEGEYLPGQPLLRGPSDMVSAVCGPTQAIMDIYDRPDDMKRLFELVTDGMIFVIKKILDLQPELNGGHLLGFYHMWYPGSVVSLQEDQSALLSPDIFEKYVLPCDERICAEFDFSLIHLHGSCRHLFDYWIDLPSLNVMQINRDEGQTFENAMQFYEYVQSKGKPLMVWGRFTREEWEPLVQRLSSRGLCLYLTMETREECRDFMKLVERHYGH